MIFQNSDQDSDTPLEELFVLALSLTFSTDKQVRIAKDTFVESFQANTNHNHNYGVVAEIK
jgi:hypothetical protein